nr:unnamed protein product [Digitaria exilis]
MAAAALGNQGHATVGEEALGSNSAAEGRGRDRRGGVVVQEQEDSVMGGGFGDEDVAAAATTPVTTREARVEEAGSEESEEIGFGWMRPIGPPGR